jgi:starch synthase
MKILLASSEVHPYSKTGGLADMAGALAKSLGRAGHKTGVVTPLYRGIRERFPDLRRWDWKLDLPLGDRTVHGGIWIHEIADNLTVYFVDHPKFFDRPSLYGEHGQDYPDNAERFIFFSKAVVNLARYLPWQPELVHVHDWQTGLVPLLILHERSTAGWGTPARTCLTVHNLAFQGFFPRAKYDLTNLPPEYFHINGVEFYGGMNFLKSGIAYADLITTVSPRYAREITTEQFGCGLDSVLRRRHDRLLGILNGVDYDEWSTVGNPHLKHPFTADDLSGKLAGKLDLQEELGLPRNPAVPLFSNISRLADQKGIEIQFGALEEMLSSEMQFSLLGSGSPHYEKAYQKLARRFPGKVAVRIGYDQGLAHRIEAGADFFLMPSQFEPCGLNQMYSLRYGAIPIVRMTGGLDDSVIDISEDPENANGIKFREYSARALAKAIRKALVLYRTPELFAHYRANGMRKDFSWVKTTMEYEKAYRQALNTPPITALIEIE